MENFVIPSSFHLSSEKTRKPLEASFFDNSYDKSSMIPEK